MQSLNSWLASGSGLSVTFKYNLEISTGETGRKLRLEPDVPAWSMLGGGDDCNSTIRGLDELGVRVGGGLDEIDRE